MEALKASVFPSLQLTSSLPKTQISHFQFYTKPTSNLQSFTKKPSRSKLFITPSAAVSTEPTNPTDTVLENESQEEKFDWFSHWYPVAPVCDLDKRVPHAKTILGIDVVVWWDRNENTWKVFDDACPHRLAPLSEGRIDQWGRLQCVYHGWCFNGSGDCKLIPQAPPDGPPVHTFKKACVAAYPSTVQNDLVWFWPNTGPEYKDILSKKKPPYFPELDDPSFTKTMLCREFPYGYEMLLENLVDPAHLPYAHFKIVRNMAPKKSVKRDREGGTPLDLNIDKFDKDGFLSTRLGGYSQFIAPCSYHSVFYLPDRAKAGKTDQGNGSLSSAEKSKEPSSNLPRRQGGFIFLCVPVGPGKSRLIFSIPRNFAVWLGKIIPRWVSHLSENLVLDSDLYLLHLAERKLLEAGPSYWQKAYFVPTKSDAQVVAYRKWLKKYAGGQVNWGGKFDGVLPPSPPKEQLMDRYWSHVVHCSSCNVAHKRLCAVEVALQVIPLVLLGILAATQQSLTSTMARSILVVMAVVCYAASRWLGHFIYKNFHFHDYNHALV